MRFEWNISNLHPKLRLIWLEGDWTKNSNIEGLCQSDLKSDCFLLACSSLALPSFCILLLLFYDCSLSSRGGDLFTNQSLRPASKQKRGWNFYCRLRLLFDNIPTTSSKFIQMKFFFVQNRKLYFSFTWILFGARFGALSRCFLTLSLLSYCILRK